MSQFDLAGVSVLIVMPVFEALPPATVRSLLETQGACLQRGLDLGIEMGVGSTVFHARSKAAHRFLNSPHNRMFMIDSDMVWTADDFLRLVALSTRMDCVCATYTARQDVPLFYVTLADQGAEIAANEYGCLPVNGVGLGFTIVTRPLVERLAARAPKIRFDDKPNEPVAKLFRFDEPNGQARGEDMAFFSDVRGAGYIVNLDPTITIGHIGTTEFRASVLDYITKLS